MKLYAPKYYKEFTCIADRCKHSCCVGWEIDIDDDTMDKYAVNTDGYGKKIIESIENDDVPHFKLCKDERCPHLNEKGLCEIILNVGEGYLCHICREHPRFYNLTHRGMEVGLGMSCEEACRIILGSDSYAEIVEIGDTDGEACDDFYDTLNLREEIYAILLDNSKSYSDKLNAIYTKFGVSPADISEEEAISLLASLEHLDETHKTLFLQYSSEVKPQNELEKPLERALAYFVYRHCTEVYDELELRASLGFCLFLERLLASVARNGDPHDVARIISEEIEYSEDNTEALKNAFYINLSKGKENE